eukprot:6206779-Pleurochrysis_carterae.AAC.3
MHDSMRITSPRAVTDTLLDGDPLFTFHIAAGTCLVARLLVLRPSSSYCAAPSCRRASHLRTQSPASAQRRRDCKQLRAMRRDCMRLRGRARDCERDHLTRSHSPARIGMCKSARAPICLRKSSHACLPAEVPRHAIFVSCSSTLHEAVLCRSTSLERRGHAMKLQRWVVRAT